MRVVSTSSGPRPEADRGAGPPTRPVRMPRRGLSGQAPAPDGVVQRTWRRVTAPRPPVPQGAVVLRGKPRAVVHHRQKPTLFRRRLAVVYDTSGPRVTLGVLWFLLVVGALAVGPGALVPLYAAMAALAGFQTASAWRAVGSKADRWVAALAAGAVAAGAAWGVGSLGLAILGAVVVTLAVAALETRTLRGVLDAAGTTLLSALPVGIGAAGVILTLRLEIGAAVTIVVLVAAYEVGDYIVGSGASSSVEGPIAGIVAIAAMCMVVAVLRVPPFDGASVFVFGGFAALGCPLGQVLASALLPSVDARAPALRRLDSLLVLGPAWALLVGILMQRVL